MSDDVPLKLPRYVFRRANGSFRYKRNVPLRLRVLLGKDTLYRQLGDSYREAMQNLPQVHAQVEAICAQETELSARQRSLNIIRGAKEVQSIFLECNLEAKNTTALLAFVRNRIGATILPKSAMLAEPSLVFLRPSQDEAKRHLIKIHSHDRQMGPVSRLFWEQL